MSDLQIDDHSGVNSSSEVLDVSSKSTSQINFKWLPNPTVSLTDSNLQDRPISTTDLISWSFQVARGMDYLISKKASLIQ
jgi:hypothetical protein